MYSAFFAPALALGSILGILAMLEWGRYLGKRALAADGEAARVGVTVIEGAVYALTGLLIVYAVLSWTQTRSHLSSVIGRLCDPFLHPIRQIVPLVGGVDLSPLVLLVALQVATMVLGSVQQAVLR